MRGPLPVYIRDPVARLRFVRKAMDGLKESKQAVGAATLAAVNNLAPPTILAQASRLNFSTRLFNLIVTNIPGPRSRCTCSGASSATCSRSRSCPSTTRWPSRSCPTTAGIDYGLLGDYDALPDIDLIAEGIDAALAELLERGAGQAGPPARGRRRRADQRRRR